MTIPEVFYGEDYADFPQKGWSFYNDPDETLIELVKDGRMICGMYIVDYMEELGLTYEDFKKDKCLYYDKFIEQRMKEYYEDT